MEERKRGYQGRRLAGATPKQERERKPQRTENGSRRAVRFKGLISNIQKLY